MPRELPLRTFIAVAVIGFGTVALAETAFPVYDVEAACSEAVGRGVRRADCIDSEQRGYDYTKANWSRLEDRFRTGCVQQFGGVVMAYTAIRQCVADSLFAQERSATRQARPFRY